MEMVDKALINVLNAKIRTQKASFKQLELLKQIVIKSKNSTKLKSINLQMDKVLEKIRVYENQLKRYKKALF